ncbi:MAG: OmpA family protein [Bacteroidia bacterium]|nr:OmpA family protein [Bacteroidia bacterium]
MYQRIVYLLLFGMLFSSIGGFAQLKKGNKLYNANKFSLAIAAYQKELEKGQNQEAMEKIADCYRRIGQIAQAEKWYQKITSKKVAPEQYLRYGQTLKMAGKYEEAKIQFEKFAKEASSDPRGQQYIKSCDFAQKTLSETNSYNADKVEKINSNMSDICPVPYKNGFIFASNRYRVDLKKQKTDNFSGFPYFDLYFCEFSQADKTFKTPGALGNTINLPLHEGPATVTADGKKLFFGRTIEKKGNPDLGIRNTTSMKIVTAVWDDAQKTWGSFADFPYNNPNYFVGHPAVSKDGNEILFVSDMPGGSGNMDLWMCRKEGNSWGKPVNLGKEVNTPGNEVFPSIHTDGTLYFSSDYHPGMGGLDVFSATKNGATYGSVQNLKMYINSSMDDFGFYLSENKDWGFVSSNRKGGKGQDDIYLITKFTPKPPVEDTTAKKPEVAASNTEKTQVNVIAVEKTKNKSLDSVVVQIFNEKEVVRKSMTDPSGKFLVELEKNYTYTTLARRKGYLSKRGKIILGNEDAIDFKIVMEKVEVGKKSDDLPNIYFDFNSSSVREQDKPILDKIIQVLHDNPALIVELASYADPVGSDVSNLILSRKRSTEAANYLTNKGLEKNRIIIMGYGEKNLIVVNAKNNEENQPNRRTEFIIRKYNPKQDKMND